MFVSSYSTYIDTSSTQRTQKERNESVKKKTEPFSLKFKQASTTQLTQTQKLPIDYISKYKILNTKQELEKQNFTNTNPAKMKFTKISSLMSAQASYSENSKMFSLRIKPKATLNQTQKLDTSLPPEAQAAQTNTMKTLMVNAYITNDNYYRITAA